MKSRFSLLSCAIAGAIALFAQSTQAATVVNLLGDTGTLRTEYHAPPTITSVTLVNPYGAPPLPALVAIPNGVSLSFITTADFLASASSASGGKTTTMDGKLDLIITFDAPVKLTTNIFEDGIWSTTGNGTVNVLGGLIVSEADNVVSTESIGNAFPAETYNGSGTWKLFDQVTGFVGSYRSYKISIDNTLIAEAIGGSPGTAYIAKKDFQITFTTDGSTGGGPPIPEPASLGVLALGSIALLARRKK